MLTSHSFDYQVNLGINPNNQSINLSLQQVARRINRVLREATNVDFTNLLNSGNSGNMTAVFDQFIQRAQELGATFTEVADATTGQLHSVRMAIRDTNNELRTVNFGVANFGTIRGSQYQGFTTGAVTTRDTTRQLQNDQQEYLRLLQQSYQSELQWNVAVAQGNEKLASRLNVVQRLDDEAVTNAARGFADRYGKVGQNPNAWQPIINGMQQAEDSATEYVRRQAEIRDAELAYGIELNNRKQTINDITQAVKDWGKAQSVVNADVVSGNIHTTLNGADVGTATAKNNTNNLASIITQLQQLSNQNVVVENGLIKTDEALERYLNTLGEEGNALRRIINLTNQQVTVNREAEIAKNTDKKNKEKIDERIVAVNNLRQAYQQLEAIRAKGDTDTEEYKNQLQVFENCRKELTQLGISYDNTYRHQIRLEQVTDELANKTGVYGQKLRELVNSTSDSMNLTQKRTNALEADSKAQKDATIQLNEFLAVYKNKVKLEKQGRTHSDQYKQVLQSYQAEIGELNKLGIKYDEVNGKFVVFGQNHDNIKGVVSDFNDKLELTNKTLEANVYNVQESISRFIEYRIGMQALTSAVNMFTNSISEMNSVMTQVRMVTMDSYEDTVKLSQEYGKLAQELGTTTVKVAEGADSWLRQGYSGEEAMTMLKNSTTLATIGQLEAADATDYLTAITKSYNIEVNDTANVVDKLVAVDLRYAASTSEIATALQKTASSAAQAGVDLDKLVGLITVSTEKTRQAPEVIGTAWQSIITRMTKVAAKVDLDDLTDELSGVTYSINDADKVLQKHGISLTDAQGNMRDLGDVIDDVGKEWTKLSPLEQNQLSYVIAGTRQRNIFIAAMEGYKDVLEATEVSATAYGTTEQKMQVYTESLEAAQNRLTAAFQNLAQNTEIDRFLATVLNLLSNLVSLLDIVLNKIPVLSTAIKALLVAVTASGAVSALGTLLDRFSGITTILSGKTLLTGLHSLGTKLGEISLQSTLANTALSKVAGTLYGLTMPQLLIGMAAISASIYAIAKGYEYWKSLQPEAIIERTTEAITEAETEISSYKSKIKELNDTITGLETGEITVENGNTEEYIKQLEEERDLLRQIVDAKKAVIQANQDEQNKARGKALGKTYGKVDVDESGLVDVYTNKYTNQLGTIGFGGFTQALSDASGNALQLLGLLDATQAKQESIGEVGSEKWLEWQDNVDAVKTKLQEQLVVLLTDKQDAIDAGLTGTAAFANIENQIDMVNKALGIVETKVNDVADAMSTQLPDAGKQLASILAEFTDKSTELGAKVSALSSAYEDMHDNGKLSIDTLAELVSQYPNLINCIETENGVTTIEIEKLNELFETEKQQKVSSIEMQIANANAVLEQTKNRINAYNQEIDGLARLKLAQQLIADGATGSVDIDSDEIIWSTNKISNTISGLKKDLDIVNSQTLSGISKASKSSSSALKDTKSKLNELKSAAESLLSLTLSMLKKEYEQQKKNLNNEKEALEKQKEAFQDKINIQKEFLELQEKELEHTKTLADKNKAIANIQEQLLELQYDNSADAQRKRLELLDELSSAEEDLTDYQHDYAVDQQKESLDNQLSNYNDYIDGLKEKIDEQIKYIDEVRLDEYNLYLEAIGLIEGRSGEFYDRLVDYNEKYGDHTEATVKQAWTVAYTALDDYGGDFKSFLNTINSQMLLIDDSTKQTTETAERLADAYERAAKAARGVLSNSGDMYAWHDPTASSITKYHDGTKSVTKSNSWLDEMLGLGSTETSAILKVGEAVIPDYANKLANVNGITSSVLSNSSAIPYSKISGNIGNAFDVQIPINIEGNATEETVLALKNAANDIANSVFQKMNQFTAMGGYKNIARATI